MAEKIEKLERVYNVPLRKEYIKKAMYKRTKKALSALRQFIQKHMKSENVVISSELNNFMWKHGIKNPPHHVKVLASRDKEGKVTVTLEGAKVEKKETKTEVKKEAKEKTEVKETKKETPVREKKPEASDKTEVKKEKPAKKPEAKKEEVKK